MTSSKVNTRFVTGLQKPKPLKSSITNSAPDVPSKYSVLACLEEAVATMDKLVTAIATKAPVDYPLCLLVAAKLRANNAQLEELYKGQLDRAFLYFRSACVDNTLDLAVRMQLGFLIELRAMGWSSSHAINSYYSSKSQILDTNSMNSGCEIVGMGGGGGEGGILGPGEVLRTSGKYSTPTKMPTKNYYKDEVIIKNHDSGKVMGIKGRRVHMIEELSETVISFQRVNPGAKERLVQITGPNEEKIELAKTLIEDTIKRNSSPVRESVLTSEQPRGGSNSSLNSSASDDSTRIAPTGTRAALRKSVSMCEPKPTTYKHTVEVGQETISLSCHDLDILTIAMIVLDRHFNGKRHNVAVQSGEASGKTKDLVEVADSSDSTPISSDKAVAIKEIVLNLNGVLSPDHSQKAQSRPRRLYSRNFLLDCCVSRACRMPPKSWDRISKEYPSIVKQVAVYFDGASYLKKWLENEGKTINILPSTEIDYPDSD